MFSRHSAVLAILAVALIAIAAAGCGGDDEESAAETSLFEPLEEEEAPSEPEPSPPAEPEPPPEPPPPAVPDLQVEVKQGEAIGPGSSGDNVATLQEALKELGYKPGKIDGKYGPNTRKAIIAFQRDQKLGADGLVGPKTAEAINTELAKAQRG